MAFLTCYSGYKIMVFSSTVFLFLFLPIVLGLYFVSPKKSRNLFLLLASLFFYAWGETFYLLIMLASIIINYFAGILIERFRAKKTGKAALTAGIIFNISLLALFKYANFAVENFNELLALVEMPLIIADPVHLPIGISFFTFQAVTYLADVYRDQVKCQKNFINIALYISLFPQLIAGPIVRYKDIAAQIEKRSVNFNDFSLWVRRFVIGLGKKMILANSMGEVADQIMAFPLDSLSASTAWLGAVCYTLQIYFNFSGYSDMAIGLGRMFGFLIPENFNYPYIAGSIREFWQRWHISLSRWLRDYLYIPLGGSRVSTLRTYVNLYVVFFLCGLWHGASWNFVIWGLFHGTFLVMERIGLEKLILRMWHPFQHIYVMAVVIIAWVFFRIENLPDAVMYLKAMCGLAEIIGKPAHMSLFMDNEKIIILAAGIIGTTPVWKALSKIDDISPGSRAQWCYSLTGAMVMISIFIFSLMLVASGTYNPFIYFRF